ncbi:MAG: DUF815 domain-containing protein [archaeon]
MVEGEIVKRVNLADMEGDLTYYDKQFTQYTVRKVKPVEQFFGYPLVKRRLTDSFDSLTAGQITLPILMDGPPGIGKTELFLSFAQKYNSPIVVSDQENLSKNLEDLLSNLGKVNKKFFLFFDDVNPSNIDWHPFRNNVCGVGNYPANVLIGIATNERFPDNVTSRCNYVVIPEFSLGIAKEMGRDYLVHQKLKSPKMIQSMINGFIIDYISSYKSTGTVSEISPRSFIRHMDYISASPERREKILLISKGEMFDPSKRIAPDQAREDLSKMKVDLRNVMAIFGTPMISDTDFLEVYRDSLRKQGFESRYFAPIGVTPSKDASNGV